jgi:hypothetical protein
MTKREKIIKLANSIRELTQQRNRIEAKITKQMLRLGKLEQ